MRSYRYKTMECPRAKCARHVKKIFTRLIQSPSLHTFTYNKLRNRFLQNFS